MCWSNDYLVPNVTKGRVFLYQHSKSRLFMKYILLFILTVFSSNSIFAQQKVEGMVIDANTKEVIPFVNIGIIKSQKGTVSNSEGMFSLTYDSVSNTVVFSAIGYHFIKLSVSDIMDSPTVLMQPQIYDLEEVVVRSDAYSESKVFGNKQKSKGNSFGYGSAELGSEIAAKIKLKKETYIESAHFTVNFIGESDSMKYRVNLYEKDGEELGQNLIRENVIVSVKQERGTFSVDLKDLEIYAQGEVLLSLEWVENPEDLDNAGMMFRAKQVRGKNANAYLRYTSLSPMRKVTAVNNQLGFYLMGREVRK